METNGELPEVLIDGENIGHCISLGNRLGEPLVNGLYQTEIMDIISVEVKTGHHKYDEISNLFGRKGEQIILTVGGQNTDPLTLRKAEYTHVDQEIVLSLEFEHVITINHGK